MLILELGNAEATQLGTPKLDEQVLVILTDEVLVTRQHLPVHKDRIAMHKQKRRYHIAIHSDGTLQQIDLSCMRLLISIFLVWKAECTD